MLVHGGIGRAVPAHAACVVGSRGLGIRIKRFRLGLRDGSQTGVVKGDGQPDNPVKIARQGSAVAMVVFAQIAGQGRALIDANLVRTGGMGQSNEGIECDRAIDGGRRCVRAPPVVRRRNRGGDVIEVASRACSVAGNSAVADAEIISFSNGAGVHLDATTLPGGGIPRDGHILKADRLRGGEADNVAP